MFTLTMMLLEVAFQADWILRWFETVKILMERKNGGQIVNKQAVRQLFSS